MIVTVFRSRLRPDAREEYIALVDRMVELAKTMPGYISHKGFFAEDDERVTIVEFEHEEGMLAWRMNPEYRAAQKKRLVKFTIQNIASRSATSSGNRSLSSNMRQSDQISRNAYLMTCRRS
ncbi:MAG TPA: antibiotic biosynthesis monooxygenase family protein [Pseudolabrys sp.]|nr:antibiotic biosynthesis monooxygenase family protein [Pseudolabrys sp.]